MTFEPVELKHFEMPKIRYIASDGKVFEGNKTAYLIHEKSLTIQRLKWYNKRYSILGELKYFLFKIEPKKPYKF